MAAVNALLRAFYEMPPVTRVYMSASILTTIAVQLEFISPFQLYFNPKLIFMSRQYWRLITTFLFFGPLGFNFLFNLVFTYRYCRMLEEEFFRNRTADFFYMFLVGGTLMCMLAYFINLLFLGHAFTIMLVYIWSRRNPGVRMNFFGLITFQAPYLPWVLLAFSILLGSSTVADIIGIIVGHFYYFFEDVFPNEPHGFRVLETPGFIKSIFDRLGVDEAPLLEENRPEQFNFTGEPQPPPATPEDSLRQDPSSNSSSPAASAEEAATTSRTMERESDQSSHQGASHEDPESQLRARNVASNSGTI